MFCRYLAINQSIGQSKVLICCSQTEDHPSHLASSSGHNGYLYQSIWMLLKHLIKKKQKLSTLRWRYRESRAIRPILLSQSCVLADQPTDIVIPRAKPRIHIHIHKLTFIYSRENYVLLEPLLSGSACLQAIQLQLWFWWPVDHFIKLSHFLSNT